MPWQDPRPAPPDLRDEVACVWSATMAGRHRLIPDGCVDLLWIDDGRMLLCGPETSAWETVLPSGTSAVGMRLRPGAAPRVFHTSARELADRRIPLEDLVGTAAARSVSEQVGAAAAASDRVTALTRLLRPRVASAARPDAGDRAMVQLLTAPSPPPIGRLATLANLSLRQLHRRSTTAFGYPPTTLVRLVRLQRLLRRAETGRWRTIAQLAHAAGYTDHAHLARECRALAGTTPRVLLGEHRPTFPGTADPYKPPRPPTGTMVA